MKLLRFLFADDCLPVALQVIWKLLTWGFAAILVAAAQSTPGTVWPLYVLAGLVFLFGTFTKVGDDRWR